MSLEEKLDKIRSPKLQNQRETAIVLSAVEDTLKEQHHDPSPTGYLAALLALLSQANIPNKSVKSSDLASSVVYLLDLVIDHVPAALLRAKFPQILTSIAPSLTGGDATAPLLRSSIGCLKTLLLAQDGAAWTLPQTEISPRRAVAGLLALASDQRPKVRKRAQDAITHILQNPPPTPSLDHPVADMCAETAMLTLSDALLVSSVSKRQSKDAMQERSQPGLIHALHLVKAISSASGGWPSRKIEPLCEVLMGVSRSDNEYLTMAAFEVFEVIFQGMADQFSSSKLPRLMEALSELKPSQNDSQLLPAWIAVISRGYDVSAQIDPEGTFHKLPDLFGKVSEFLSSASYEIRVSASECLISFLVNCVPDRVIAEPSAIDEKTLGKVARSAQDLLNVRFQAAWMEVFNVEAAFFEALRWRAIPLARSILTIIDELRASVSFNGKKEADMVIGKAIQSMGPEAVLRVLPLNLVRSQKGQPGRAWLLPLLRDNVINTKLAHFRSEFVPLSEAMYQRVIDHGESEKTMEVKIFETIVHQTWSLLPGYANLPLDLVQAFDQEFAELLSNLLYSQPELRPDVCRALQILVESNQELLAVDAKEHEILMRSRVTKTSAQSNLDHLSNLSGNLLAVLFNVYTQTLPQFRGYILQCINAYLSITKEKELLETFVRVTEMLENALVETTTQPQPTKQSSKGSSSSQMPPTTHTLMDLIITLSIYLPLATFPQLFTLTSRILPLTDDPQLQKKAYKLLPRLATSDSGALALGSHNRDLQSLILSSAATASPPARRDRLLSLATIIDHLPSSDLYFIPSIISEAVIATKEVNEKARSAAFDLLVLMGRKMGIGGTIEQSKIPHIDPAAPTVEASLEEFFTMVSAGLVGETPHMVSASITALTRILYEFHRQLPHSVVEDLVSTLSLFLTSNNREIVRSCLGFTKVIVVSLPAEIVLPRLEALVPGLLSWSKEHKSRFRAKVKHIVERMIRRFGVHEVEKWCPEDGKKLVQNIRKTKERKKRKKSEAAEEGVENDEEREISRKGRFESEYEEAIYDSDDDEESDVASNDADRVPKAKPNNQKAAINGRGTYITELPDDEPLDLLSASALSHISTSKPAQFKSRTRTKAKVDLDGKLILGNANGTGKANDDTEPMAVDPEEEPGDGTLEGGINAYVEAIRGRDAVQRGRGGRLKFSNKRNRGGDEMQIDEEEAVEDKKQRNARGSVVKARGHELNRSIRSTVTKRGGRDGARSSLAKKRFDPKTQRKGLGVQKVKGGRVEKTSASKRR
ncbi:pre-rRNA processing protein [Xanthoria calcicola]